MATLRQELTRRGFSEAALDGDSAAPLLCAETLVRLRSIHRIGYKAFTVELEQAQPLIDGYLFAVRVAEEANFATSPDLAERLKRRTLGEQMLRRGVFWDEGPIAGAPALTPMGRIIAQDQLGREMIQRDYANTEWLKGIVAEQGWPLISEVGATAAQAVFFLVQHADRDPVFQLDTLRLMEPLVASGEVAPRSYAYLYDRVMLKLTEQQRYGTQAVCQDGKFQPRTLEDETSVDDLRRTVGLDLLSEYLAMMLEHSGSCLPLPAG